MDGNIDCGTNYLEITNPITLDLGNHTLATHVRNYGIALKNTNTIVTITQLNYAGTVADETNPKTGDFTLMPMTITTISTASLAILLIDKKNA